MKKLVYGVLGFGIFFLLGWWVYRVMSPKALIDSLSPNKEWHVIVTEPTVRSDRNLMVFVERNDKSLPIQKIWTSPDERQELKVRLVWAKDSKRILLLGTGGYWAWKEIELKSGEGLYLIYDLTENQLLSNRASKSSKFTFKEVAKYEWMESVEPAYPEALK